MGRPRNGSSKLRGGAASPLAERPPEGQREQGGDPIRLLHELQVHQVELETQNEELTASRRAAEQALARYTGIFERAPIAYFVMAGGTIASANFAAASLLGREPSALVGLPLTSFVAGSDQGAFTAFLGELHHDVRERHQSRQLELSLEGEPPRQVRATAAALDPSEVLLAFEDISALRRAEQALLEELQNKNAFLAALSHELRNPLTPIRNSLRVHERSEPGSERARNAQAVIDRQLAHLTRIIDDLLDVTRIGRGKMLLRREPVELGEVLHRAISDHGATFEAAGVELEARFGSGKLWVAADPTRLTQVLGNLLGNGVKFTPRGGKVMVSLRREEDTAALVVSDTGVGIAADVRPHVFDAFSQAPQPLARTRGGLGLGLALVKGLVELHGGSVALYSGGTGLGTEVTVRLPLIAAPAPARAEPQRPPSPGRRVLVFEDNVDGADSLREALELSGHRVAVAYDGRSGLETARRFRQEVIVCDIGLPDVDGYEVARACRVDPDLRRCRLIALSGYALPDDLRRAREAGYDRHLAKPASLDDLEALLAEAPDRN